MNKTLWHSITWMLLITLLLGCSSVLVEATTPVTNGEETHDPPDTEATIADEAGDLTYPVVDTGQTACYDDSREIACPSSGEAFYGQDAQFTGNAPSYTNNNNGTITDNVTGLIWQQSPDTEGDGDIDANDKLPYTEACAYCENLSLAGYDDWRLPDIKQLYSLIDFRGTDPMTDDTTGLIPFIDTDYFDFGYGDLDAGERVLDAQYASSTLYVADSNQMFGVNFADGRIKGYGLTRPGGEELDFYVLCVRGNSAYGVNDFTDNGDPSTGSGQAGTITDSATGLMWAQDDSGVGMTWEEALAYVEAQNATSYLGYSDWRLPNAKELQSIVDYGRSPDTTGSAAIDPLFNATSITNEAGETDYPFYWSSTTHARADGGGSAAAYVAFGRSLGYMNDAWVDVHGAGAQRSDPKAGDPADYPNGRGPQGDAIHIYNYVRLVRDADEGTSPVQDDDEIYMPLIQGATATVEPDTGGYTLFAPLNETTTYLINEAGETVFTWESSYRPGNAVYLLENGNLLHTGNTQSNSFDVGGAGGIVEELAPDGSVVWSFEFDTAQGRLHHDVEPLPNGNVLMLAWGLKSEAEAIAAGRDPGLLNEGELWLDTVIEVDPATNTIVWEWYVWDHLVQDYDETKANYGVVADHPELIDLNYYGPNCRPGGADWNHINAIDYNADLDQILLSVRNFSEIWVIDHSTTAAEAAGHTGGKSGMGGDLLYRWGNPAAYDSGDTRDQQLFVQHDAQWIPEGYPGAGNILLFNNGQGRTDGDYSSVEEIVPPVDGAGNYTGYGPAASAWTYVADSPTDLYAQNISGAQRLPNGNTLICDGPSGYLFEVDSNGDVVWEFDYGNAPIFRAIRYEANVLIP